VSRMPKAPTTHREILKLWPNLYEVAGDLDCTHYAVKGMSARDSIDSKHWLRLVEAARKRRIPHVTLKLLAEIDAEKASA
jgi:hypothetical protein